MNQGDALSAGAAALRAAGIANARHEARWLAEHVTGRPCLPGSELHMTPAHQRRYTALLRRRAQRYPLQYLLAEVEFCGVPLRVTPKVLIPRPETEELAVHALAWLACHPRARRVADLGTGSGCLAIALAHAVPRVRCWACDMSNAALAVARANAHRNGVAGRITFAHSAWFDAVPARRRFDVIVANPPYVAEGARLQPELAHEPPTALFAGTDGLAAYREILPELPRRMAAHGLFLGEIGQGQAPALGALARRAGMRHVSFLPDCSGRLRFLRVAAGG